MKGPKEDPVAKAERERQRKRAEADRRDAAQKNAASLTKDLSAVYSRPSLFSTVSR